MPVDGYPKLRALEITPVEVDGRTLFLLQDRLGIGTPLLLSQQAALIATLLDGSRTLAGVRAALLLRFGFAPSEAELAEFVARLDEACLLAGGRFAERLAAEQQAFSALPVRPAAHAGGAYPGDPEELRAFLDGLYRHPQGPGAPPDGVAPEPLVGLIAPHIDFHRGGPTYAWGYRALAEAPPADRYVILGTIHTPMASAFAATRKPYDTPFGPAPVDHAFLNALARRYRRDLLADEFSHRNEHSIEFQAVYLRYLGLAGAGRAKVVTILCNSPHALVSDGRPPSEAAEVVEFVQALRETIATAPGRTCLIAGADLAHVGPQFGDPFAVTAAVLRQVEASDREMLEHVCRGDADGFYRQVMRDGDARRICGLAPIYTLLAALGPARGELLRYAQWADPSGRGAVTFASVAFWGS